MRHREHKGDRWVFFGVVWGDDDLYYGMWRRRDGKQALLSCGGSIEGWGYTLADSAP